MFQLSRQLSRSARRAFVLVAALVATACGGGGGSGPAPDATTPGASRPAAPSPTSSAPDGTSSAPVAAFQPWGPSLVSDEVSADEPGTSVARLGAGGSVVSWTEHGQPKAQVFGADGSRIGNALMIATTLSGSRAFSVAALDNGQWVLAWVGSNDGAATPDGAGEAVYFQRFTANGTAIDGLRPAGPIDVQVIQTPAVHATADGGFVIGWAAKSSVLPHSGRAYVAWFTADGVGAAGPTAVSDMAGDQDAVSVLPQSNGSVVVSWNQASANGSSAYTRLFDAAGRPSGPEHQLLVAAQAKGSSMTRLALSEDKVAIAWLAGNRVSWQILDVEGMPMGEPMTLPASTHELNRIEVVDAGGGSFDLLVQQSTVQSPQTDFSTITVQRVSGAGAPAGAPVDLVTRKIAGLTQQGLPAHSASFDFSASGGSDGHLVVAYQVCTDASIELQALAR